MRIGERNKACMYKRALSGLLVINLIFLIGVLSLCRMEEICRKLQQTVSEVHMEESLGGQGKHHDGDCFPDFFRTESSGLQ